MKCSPKKALGDGVAIIPEVGELRAPAAGTIQMVFETKHSLGMTTANARKFCSMSAWIPSICKASRLRRESRPATVSKPAICF